MSMKKAKPRCVSCKKPLENPKGFPPFICEATKCGELSVNELNALNERRKKQKA
jgi:predicted RNA-binding Zn-ribbon protein involved in translation (DUF1610 family)